jgi:hypothetical protein
VTNTATKELVQDVVSLPHLGLLHYLLSESDNVHVAHCLELDLVATGQTCESAAEKLDRLVKSHIELALATQQLANLATRAPQSFWDEFADGTQIALEPRTIRIQIPEAVQIVPVPESRVRIVMARSAHAA